MFQMSCAWVLDVLTGRGDVDGWGMAKGENGWEWAGKLGEESDQWSVDGLVDGLVVC
jgi:hypothetical protein